MLCYADFCTFTVSDTVVEQVPHKRLADDGVLGGTAAMFLTLRVDATRYLLSGELNVFSRA